MMSSPSRIPKEIEDAIVDSIVSIPQEFHLGELVFRIYPLSLGKTLLFDRVVKNFDGDTLEDKITSACTNRPDEAAELIAMLVAKDKSEIDDTNGLKKTSALIRQHCSAEDMVQLLVLILSQPTADLVSKGTDIEKHHERMAEISRRKSNDDFPTFGGVTLYGQLLDRAAERYGWTKEYIVWGIDLTSLQLMLKDAVTSVYVGKDDKGVADRSNCMDADNPDNIEKILALNWD